MDSSSERVFDDFCRICRIGSRHDADPTEPPWFVELLRQVRFRTANSAQVFFGELHLRSHVDVYRGDSFNAFAASHDGLQLIGFSSTLLACLYPLAGLVARYSVARESLHRKLLAELRDVNWTTLTGANQAIDRMLLRGPLVPAQAQQFHLDIFWQAVNVILHHEMAHLYCGHAAHLKQDLGLAMASERALVDPDLELAHAMEIQADMGVCLWLKLLSKEPTRLETALLSSLLVFMLLCSASAGGGHPHPLVRLHLLVQRTGNETGIDDDAFNRLLDRVRARIPPIGIFASATDMTHEQMHAAAQALERTSNEHLALFDPFRMIVPGAQPTASETRQPPITPASGT